MNVGAGVCRVCQSCVWECVCIRFQTAQIATW